MSFLKNQKDDTETITIIEKKTDYRQHCIDQCQLLTLTNFLRNLDPFKQF